MLRISQYHINEQYCCSPLVYINYYHVIWLLSVQQKSWWQWRNVPPLQAISMAMLMHFEVIQSTSSDPAWPGLHRKPLDAATEWLLAPYSPTAARKKIQNKGEQIHPLCWPCWWPLQCSVTIPHTSPIVGGTWLHKKPLVATIGQVFAPIASIGHAYRVFCSKFHCQHVEKGHEAKGWSLLTIGVWHVKMMKSA